MEFISEVAVSFAMLFLIMDPFASMGPFLALTKDCKEDKMRATATEAIIIAGVIGVVFALGGTSILSFMKITLNDFKLAGGLVLGLLGLENVLGFSFVKKEGHKFDMDAVAVLIATPLLTGPGLVSTLILIVSDYGLIVTFIAFAAALFIAWLILSNAVYIRKIFGKSVVEIFSKIIGLLLIALGVSYMRSGLIG